MGEMIETTTWSSGETFPNEQKKSYTKPEGKGRVGMCDGVKTHICSVR